MKEGVVYRQGRTVQVSKAQRKGERQCCTLFFLPLLALLTLTFFPYQIYTSERFYWDQQVAFNHVDNLVVEAPPVAAGGKPYAQPDGTLLHLTAEYEASTSDHSFGIKLNHSLKLQRYTEYCQWQEFTTRTCQTCKDSDGNDEECSCRDEYSYTKAWRNARINSLGFDQAAYHHNPQRDPFPSDEFTSSDMRGGGYHVRPELAERVKDSSVWRGIFGAHEGRPVAFHPNVFARRLSFWERIFGANEMRTARMETVASQLSQFRSSPAFTGSNKFVYTNHERGWFFSPYQEEAWVSILRGFSGFLEGSLFDWQIGDVYDWYNGCTAGDIRVLFYVVDPDEVSVIGGVMADNTELGLYKSPNGFSVGVLHGGALSADTMFAREAKEAHWRCNLWRLSSILAGAAGTYVLVAWLGVDVLSPLGMAAGLALLLLGLVHATVHGLSDWSGHDSDAWTVAAAVGGAVLIFRSASQRHPNAKVL